jgi:hypothetical protein
MRGERETGMTRKRHRDDKKNGWGKRHRVRERGTGMMKKRHAWGKRHMDDKTRKRSRDDEK